MLWGMRRKHLAITLTLAAVFLCVHGAADGLGEQYLSDVYDALVLDARQDWGKLGLDTAVVPPDGRPAEPLRIGEKVYEKGLGHHANGAMLFDLAGKYAAFDAEVGVNCQGKGSVVFQVLVDGEKRFNSGCMSSTDPAKAVCVPLAGAHELCLLTLDAGDGIACDVANWANARLTGDASVADIAEATVVLCEKRSPPPSSTSCGFSLIAHDTGPQVAVLGRTGFIASVGGSEEAVVSVPVRNLNGPFTVSADVTLIHGEGVEVTLVTDGNEVCRNLTDKARVRLEAVSETAARETVVRLGTQGLGGAAAAQWRNVRLKFDERVYDLTTALEHRQEEAYPPRVLPALHPPIEAALIEWDWRMQDGIGTAREPSTYAAAIERTLRRGSALIRDLQEDGVALDEAAVQWEALKGEWEELSTSEAPDEQPQWEALWQRVHLLRRRVALANPLAQCGPLLFAKQVPGAFSHQLTQYYGRHARPGGGLFVLDAPGASMACRCLAPDALPEGSYMQPEVSYDGQRILFAYCASQERTSQYYHLCDMAADGSQLRQLTDGPYDDFSPRELPNGKIVFVSTRRGGYHRCGAGPCDVYTLAIAEADGSSPHTVSYHETHEWDPAVLADGRIIYTRWDYVDRNAVHYQQLWMVRPDGTAPAAYYGNNTFNPVGVWEARQVPDTNVVMATAAAHHAMTAGSIILLDTTKGVDGIEAITRLTPDAPFPESETYVTPRNWHAPGSPKEYVTPAEARRWPGHCYRSPHPLSEKYFLAAYSYDPLIGEPDANKANMFGVYLVDAFGNKELLYRDLNIASLWPVPLRARPRPPLVPSNTDATLAGQGTFLLQDVYASLPALPEGSVKRLRIVQVLPKTTPNANKPTVGLANASPGKQVLGTVPVEADGSAHFAAPAGIPLAFQALDEFGRAIQVMRSVTYLQPGERTSCVGCHEHRLSAPPEQGTLLALARPPSAIDSGPDGSKPFSYPLLVQPVLDRHCVGCHGGDEPKGPDGKGIVLTGAAEGRYTASYNVLAPRVPYSSWEGANLAANCEPLTQPGHFGARGSRLMDMLLDGHQDIELPPGDLERLVTWMDANALFYGTFNREDQARQQLGERIEGPELQ